MAANTIMAKADMMAKEVLDALLALAAEGTDLMALAEAADDLLALAEKKAEILALLEDGAST